MLYPMELHPATTTAAVKTGLAMLFLLPTTTAGKEHCKPSRISCKILWV
jgi:hypothetical protein